MLSILNNSVSDNGILGKVPTLNNAGGGTFSGFNNALLSKATFFSQAQEIAPLESNPIITETFLPGRSVALELLPSQTLSDSLAKQPLGFALGNVLNSGVELNFINEDGAKTEWYNEHFINSKFTTDLQNLLTEGGASFLPLLFHREALGQKVANAEAENILGASILSSLEDNMASNYNSTLAPKLPKQEASVGPIPLPERLSMLATSDFELSKGPVSGSILFNSMDTGAPIDSEISKENVKALALKKLPLELAIPGANCVNKGSLHEELARPALQSLPGNKRSDISAKASSNNAHNIQVMSSNIYKDVFPYLAEEGVKVLKASPSLAFFHYDGAYGYKASIEDPAIIKDSAIPSSSMLRAVNIKTEEAQAPQLASLFSLEYSSRVVKAKSGIHELLPSNKLPMDGVVYDMGYLPWEDVLSTFVQDSISSTMAQMKELPSKDNKFLLKNTFMGNDISYQGEFTGSFKVFPLGLKPPGWEPSRLNPHCFILEINPKELGPVEVSLAFTDAGAVDIAFKSLSNIAVESINGHLNCLEEMLLQQGFEKEQQKITVSLLPHETLPEHSQGGFANEEQNHKQQKAINLNSEEEHSGQESSSDNSIKQWLWGEGGSIFRSGLGPYSLGSRGLGYQGVNIIA